MSLELGIFLSGSFVMALFTLFIAFTIYEVRRYNPHAFKRELPTPAAIPPLRTNGRS